MPPLTTHVLRETRDILESEARWCQGSMARNAEGRPANHLGIYATQWCLLGALYRAADRKSTKHSYLIVENTRHYLQLALKASEWQGFNELAVFNDLTTYAFVVTLLDRAIKLATERGH